MTSIYWQLMCIRSVFLRYLTLAYNPKICDDISNDQVLSMAETWIVFGKYRKYSLAKVVLFSLPLSANFGYCGEAFSKSKTMCISCLHVLPFTLLGTFFHRKHQKVTWFFTFLRKGVHTQIISCNICFAIFMTQIHLKGL